VGNWGALGRVSALHNRKLGGTWALPPETLGGRGRIRIGGRPVRKGKNVNSAIFQVLSELLMSKSAEHFLLKTQKSFFKKPNQEKLAL
jgi:hypothetical protein